MGRWLFGVGGFLQYPVYPGVQITWRRVLNMYRARWAQKHCRLRTSALPIKLTLEPQNVCNLRCPACFTGLGEVGRSKAPLSMDLYRRLLDELGPTLWQIEFYNWGEPLLFKNIYRMIEEAHAFGISTQVNTNFSLAFDAERAERLVRSGLSILGVSIDGAQQAVYEQYRVRGDLATVLRNCALVRDAKKRLGSSTPHMIWGYHVFPFNTGDIEAARALAGELEMEFAVSKGWLIGPDWDPEGKWVNPEPIFPMPCIFLWQQAVVNNDGGVAPCCGTFYSEDDMGSIASQRTGGGAATFREVWNGEQFQLARRFFRSRTGTPEERKHICYNCPVTVEHERAQKHNQAGGAPEAFESKANLNDGFNYFWARRPPDAKRRLAARAAIPERK
jgi:hypothetical protein